MGAENSVFDSCEWSTAVKHGHWSIRHGIVDDGHEISVFSCTKVDKKQENVLRKFIKHLKLVRHPCILMYIKSEETEDGPQLCTEKATPLEAVLPELTPTEISAGLNSILEALCFLHEKAAASHNNVHMGAVYVTSDGTWKLGGLEHMTKFTESTSTTLSASRPFRDKDALAPEEKLNTVIPDIECGHARDVYAFAVLAESLLERMADLGDLTKTFELRIQDECLNTDPKQRPKVHSLLTDRLFTTDFLQISAFLKYITLKSTQERSDFFKDLLPKLLHLPEELVAKRLVPSLLSRFVFLDQSAVEHILPSVLTPCIDSIRPSSPSTTGEVTPLFTEAVFQKYVVPKLVKIFTVHEFHIHLLLLKYFSAFVHLVDKESLEIDIFPQVLLGLRDSSEQIASLSLHALGDMVLILGRDIVIGGHSKKFFKEGMPKHGDDRQQPMYNNKQSNVRGMMAKMKLVDMARHGNKNSNSKSSTDTDSDRKWKEREQHREEMKKRREERKLAREKPKANSNQSANDEDGGHDLTARSSRETPITENGNSLFDENEAEEYPMHSPDWSDSGNSPAAVNKKKDDDWSIRNDDIIEMETADWSDVDNYSELSEEIEKEIQSIELNSAGEIYTPGPISPRQEKVKPISSSKNAMKLVTNKKKSDKNTENTLSLSPPQTNPTIISQSKTSPAKSQQHQLHSKPNQDLGSEFDIKSLEFKIAPEKQSAQFDFFSDMTPQIETKAGTSSLTTGLGTGLTAEISSAVDQNTTSVSSSSKLAYDVTNLEVTEEGGGWGDDDW